MKIREWESGVTNRFQTLLWDTNHLEWLLFRGDCVDKIIEKWDPEVKWCPDSSNSKSRTKENDLALCVAQLSCQCHERSLVRFFPSAHLFLHHYSWSDDDFLPSIHSHEHSSPPSILERNRLLFLYFHDRFLHFIARTHPSFLENKLSLWRQKTSVELKISWLMRYPHDSGFSPDSRWTCLKWWKQDKILIEKLKRNSGTWDDRSSTRKDIKFVYKDNEKAYTMTMTTTTTRTWLNNEEATDDKRHE